MDPSFVCCASPCQCLLVLRFSVWILLETLITLVAAPNLKCMRWCNVWIRGVLSCIAAIANGSNSSLSSIWTHGCFAPHCPMCMLRQSHNCAEPTVQKRSKNYVLFVEWWEVNLRWCMCFAPDAEKQTLMQMQWSLQLNLRTVQKKCTEVFWTEVSVGNCNVSVFCTSFQNGDVDAKVDANDSYSHFSSK